MTRKELARYARALRPYMSSQEACDAGLIAEGLDMSGTPVDVSRILGMVAPHVRKEMPDGLKAIIAQMDKKAQS